MNPDYAKIGIQYIKNNSNTDLFSIRKTQLSSLIKELYHQIRQREQIKECNLYNINKDTCKIDTEIMGQEQFSYDNTNALKLQNKLIDLEKEKRDQLSQFFKDTMSLQKSLIYTIADYQKIKQKEQMM